MWHAKIYGGYGFTSEEARDNIQEINWTMNEWGYTLEAQAGIIGNLNWESRMNPWKWQNDRVNEGYTNGYGLFQYTPASRYFNHCSDKPYYGPSLSTSEDTPGMTPEDAICQLNSFRDNELHDWLNYGWRSYWDREAYVDMYERFTTAMDNWGTNGRLSQAAYSQITDEGDAAILFMACYLGPGGTSEPNWRSRIQSARQCLDWLSTDPRPTPGQSTSKMIYYLRPLWWNSIRNGRR